MIALEQDSKDSNACNEPRGWKAISPFLNTELKLKLNNESIGNPQGCMYISLGRLSLDAVRPYTEQGLSRALTVSVIQGSY